MGWKRDGFVCVFGVNVVCAVCVLVSSQVVLIHSLLGGWIRKVLHLGKLYTTDTILRYTPQTFFIINVSRHNFLLVEMVSGPEQRSW